VTHCIFFSGRYKNLIIKCSEYYGIYKYLPAYVPMSLSSLGKIAGNHFPKIQ
jgi:hypothetical protein